MESYLDLKNGDTLHYVYFGTGQNVILLPSLWLTSKSYVPLAKELSKKFKVFIPDLYRGKSKFRNEAKTLDDYTNHLNLFIRSLDLKEYCLVGVSFSGLVTLKYVLNDTNLHPKKMFLVSTSANFLNIKHKFLLFLWGYSKLFFYNSFSLNGLKINFIWITDAFYNFFKHPKQYVLEAKIAITDYQDKITSFAMPTKLLFAERDEFISNRHINQMKNINNLEIETRVDHHTWFFYRENELAEKIIDFFS